MLNLDIQNNICFPQPLKASISTVRSDEKPIEEQIKDSIVRDLRNLNWEINVLKAKIEITPPNYYNKEIIRQSMSVKRDEIIRINKRWIDKYIDFARANLANGYEVLNSEIKPFIEVCETKEAASAIQNIALLLVITVQRICRKANKVDNSGQSIAK